MDDALIRKESEALKASVDYMVRWFNGSVSYDCKKTSEKRRKEVPIISKQADAFWTQCTESFKGEVVELLDVWRSNSWNFDDKQEPDPCEGCDASDESATPAADTNDADDPGSIWISPLQNLEDAYDELKLWYDFTSEQVERLDDLFAQLQKTVGKSIDRVAKSRKLNGTTLGRINFKYLSHMLNIERTEVQELLPYLLTAYTFNFVENRFFDRGGRLISMIYPDNVESAELMVTSADAAKMRPSIKTLSKVFSLEKCKQALLSLDKSELSESERHEPFFAIFDKIYVKPPYIRYKLVLDRAFDIWCGVIYEYAPLAGINGFPSNIDWEACKKLYSSYTD